MLAPEHYVEQFKNASYLEILKFKNELVSLISNFEHDYEMEDSQWGERPSPDVYYQWNLKVLGLIAPMLSEAFNREYEWGEKNMDDYADDMRRLSK